MTQDPKSGPQSMRFTIKARVVSMPSWELFENQSASAPLKDLQRRFGFEPEKVVRAAREQIARGGHASKEQGSRKPQSKRR